jgi:hypothetical protein
MTIGHWQDYVGYCNSMTCCSILQTNSSARMLLDHAAGFRQLVHHYAHIVQVPTL